MSKATREIYVITPMRFERVFGYTTMHERRKIDDFQTHPALRPTQSLRLVLPTRSVARHQGGTPTSCSNFRVLHATRRRA